MMSDKSTARGNDKLLSDIQHLKEQVRIVGQSEINTHQHQDDNKRKEKEYWNKLLEANIRSGTVACMWCIKAQIVKKVSLAFYKWKYTTLTGSPHTNNKLPGPSPEKVGNISVALNNAVDLMNRIKTQTPSKIDLGSEESKLDAQSTSKISGEQHQHQQGSVRTDIMESLTYTKSSSEHLDRYLRDTLQSRETDFETKRKLLLAMSNDIIDRGHKEKTLPSAEKSVSAAEGKGTYHRDLFVDLDASSIHFQGSVAGSVAGSAMKSPRAGGLDLDYANRVEQQSQQYKGLKRSTSALSVKGQLKSPSFRMVDRLMASRNDLDNDGFSVVLGGEEHGEQQEDISPFSAEVEDQLQSEGQVLLQLHSDREKQLQSQQQQSQQQNRQNNQNNQLQSEVDSSFDQRQSVSPQRPSRRSMSIDVSYHSAASHTSAANHSHSQHSKASTAGLSKTGSLAVAPPKVKGGSFGRSPARGRWPSTSDSPDKQDFKYLMFKNNDSGNYVRDLISPRRSHSRSRSATRRDVSDSNVSNVVSGVQHLSSHLVNESREKSVFDFEPTTTSPPLRRKNNSAVNQSLDTSYSTVHSSGSVPRYLLPTNSYMKKILSPGEMAQIHSSARGPHSHSKHVPPSRRGSSNVGAGLSYSEMYSGAGGVNYTERSLLDHYDSRQQLRNRDDSDHHSRQSWHSGYSTIATGNNSQQHQQLFNHHTQAHTFPEQPPEESYQHFPQDISVILGSPPPKNLDVVDAPQRGQPFSAAAAAAEFMDRYAPQSTQSSHLEAELGEMHSAMAAQQQQYQQQHEHQRDYDAGNRDVHDLQQPFQQLSMGEEFEGHDKQNGAHQNYVSDDHYHSTTPSVGNHFTHDPEHNHNVANAYNTNSSSSGFDEYERHYAPSRPNNMAHEVPAQYSGYNDNHFHENDRRFFPGEGGVAEQYDPHSHSYSTYQQQRRSGAAPSRQSNGARRNGSVSASKGAKKPLDKAQLRLFYGHLEDSRDDKKAWNRQLRK